MKEKNVEKMKQENEEKYREERLPNLPLVTSFLNYNINYS